MKHTVRFRIVFNPHQSMNIFLQACDLFKEGEGVGYEQIIAVTFKEGELIDKARIEKVVSKLKEAYESQHCEVLNVESI